MNDIEFMKLIKCKEKEYMEAHASILKKLKALEVIKNKLGLEVCIDEEGKIPYYLLASDLWSSIPVDITKEEYKLLKEVLENE